MDNSPKNEPRADRSVASGVTPDTEPDGAAGRPGGLRFDRDGWARFLATPEGRIFAGGLVLAVVMTLAIAAIWSVDRKTGGLLGGMTAANVVFGRAAGLSLGYAGELGHWLVVGFNILVETILVLLIYPLFVIGWRRLRAGRQVSRMIAPVAESAARHQDKVQRYGIIGLMAFVWIPFWMTGPIVGCAIGYLLGLKAWVNLTVVLGSTYVAVFCWALLMREFQGHLATYGAMAPVAFVVLLILIALGAQLLHRHHGR